MKIEKKWIEFRFQIGSEVLKFDMNLGTEIWTVVRTQFESEAWTDFRNKVRNGVGETLKL